MFIGIEVLLACGAQVAVDGEGVQVSVSFEGCMVASDHGWFVVPLACSCFVSSMAMSSLCCFLRVTHGLALCRLFLLEGVHHTRVWF